ncbi:MAG TPA: NAD(P)/FAD-dependent oxidoreductase [Chloroflexota bacterium]|nr:NAD(P)/FAD-dependent oxidoreductase [Chloroflexota bacterium]
MARRTGILGGGALGLTLAYRLAAAGDQVTVVEREPEPGGLAAGFRVGPSWLEKFYHHLFRSDRAATALIEEVGLGHRLVWPRPVTSTLYNGRIRQFDSPLSLLRYRPLPLPDRLRMAAVLAYLKLEKSHTRLEGKTADQWLRTWMGARGYQMQWEPLLKSKFHDHYSSVALPWFWSRVHLRSSQLGYIRGGFQNLYNRLAELVGERGGDLRFGQSVTGIAGLPGGGVRVCVDNTEMSFDRVVSTLPTRLTIALTQGLPDDYRARHDWGQALGAHCVILELHRRLLDTTYWLNINDPGYPFLALVEHTNYMPLEDYDGRYLIYLGNYLPMDHPLFRQGKDEVLAAFLPHLRRINPNFREEWVTGAHIFAAPYAQPVVTPEYREHIPPHTTPIRDLYLANMFQVYPQDRGQNYSIAMAERLARRLTAKE